MTPDRIEQLLRSEPVADEARFVARPLPATVAAARATLERGRTPSRALMLAASVAVAALVVAIGWAASLAILPDAQIDVGDGGIASVPPSNSPEASTSELPACGAGDFVVASDPWDAGAGSRGTRVVLRVSDSTASCVLPAMWGAEIRDADGTILVRATERTFAAHEATAGALFELEVYWSNWCGDAPVAPQLLLLLDNDSVVADPADGSPILVPPCMGSEEPSTLNVGSPTPSERVPSGS